MDFTKWLHNSWTNLLSWFGVEAQKLASFLYPVFSSTSSLIKNDFLTDVIALVPAVAEVLKGGDIEAALSEAKNLLLPLIEKQGKELAQTDINIISNGIVAQAQASLNVQSATGAASTTSA